MQHIRRCLLQFTTHSQQILMMGRRGAAYSNLKARTFYEQKSGDAEHKSQILKLQIETCDLLSNKLSACTCVNDVLIYLKHYHTLLTTDLIAKSVLTLWNLQRAIYNQQIGFDLADTYYEQIANTSEFQDLLFTVKSNINDFNDDSLSTVLFCLHKIGLSNQHPVMQLMIKNMHEKLINSSKPKLQHLSRFMGTVQKDPNVYSYFANNMLVEELYNHLKSIETVEDLKLVAICLNGIQEIVGKDKLIEFNNVVSKFLNENILEPDHKIAIFKVITFLNISKWRNLNTSLICSLLNVVFKDGKYIELSVEDILFTWEVFVKLEEPGNILNDLQRSASRYLRQLEEDNNPSTTLTRLKLIYCLSCFTTPKRRAQICLAMNDYIKKCKNDSKGLLEICRIISFIKYSDYKHFVTLWENILSVMEFNVKFRKENLLKVCNYYMHVYEQLGMRVPKFEKRMNQWLEGEIEQGIVNLIPSDFATLAAFSLAFGKDVSITNFIVQKIKRDLKQFNYVEAYIFVKGLDTGIKLNPTLSQKYVNSLKGSIRDLLSNESESDLHLSKINLMIKTNFKLRNQNDLTFKLIQCIDNFEELNSVVIKTMALNLLASNYYKPDVIQALVDYVCTYKYNLMGFNAENVAYLCYNFGYIPSNVKEFSRVLIDIIVRDHERLTSVTYLQCCLTLCYFNTITEGLIRQVFNTVFLDRLDTELVNCYGKEVYPLKVRQRLMELNRTICLDFPEANVPWFHQKYIEQTSKKTLDEQMEYEDYINPKVYEHLLEVFKNPDQITTNVITPYGYNLDFVITLEEQMFDQFTRVEDNSKRLAILVFYPSAYTTGQLHLKGPYQQKQRHIEMLGYNLAVINYYEWNSLFYGQEKSDYLVKLIKPYLNVNR